MVDGRVCGVLAASGLAASLALAGGGPENILLLVDPSDPQALRLANVYMAARKVPSTNVMYMDPASTSHAELARTNLAALRGELLSRVIEDHIDYILVVPGQTTPFFVPVSSTIVDTCSPVRRIALSSAYTMAFITDEVLAGLQVTHPNHFFNSADPGARFDSSIPYLGGAASTSPLARRYYIGAMLGYTGDRGNSLPELLTMVNRAVMADGTRPAGTFYFMNNTADPARNVRQPWFAPTIAYMTTLGAVAQEQPGVLPLGAQDCLGIMTGASAPAITTANITLLPGAFADHLTSYAAAFDVAQQTKLSRWIGKGAAGSVGAVEEPCNYLGKFPSPRVHSYLFQGMSLGEAALRSLEHVPFQMLLYGDPLTRPFAFIPTVNVANAPTSPVSGVVRLTPTGSTTRPATTMFQYELLVDGVSKGVVPASFSFDLDTRDLSDGWHDVRVVGFDSTPIRTQGRWLGSIRTSNFGRSATAQVTPTSGNLDTRFTFQLTGAGATVRELRLVHAGRIVGALSAAGGAVELFGHTLGAGDVSLQVEALFEDGRVARSEPVTVAIDPGGVGPTAVPPTAFSCSVRATPGRAMWAPLPATSDAPVSQVAFTLDAPPEQGTVLTFDGSGYVLFSPRSDARGADVVVFRATTGAGASSPGVVRIEYDGCAPDCDQSTGPGALDIFDFLCFQNSFAAAASYACNCDTATGPNVCDIFDFLCFQNAFAAGCP